MDLCFLKKRHRSTDWFCWDTFQKGLYSRKAAVVITMTTGAPIQTKEQFRFSWGSGMDISDPVWHGATQSWWQSWPTNHVVRTLSFTTTQLKGRHVWEQTFEYFKFCEVDLLHFLQLLRCLWVSLGSYTRNTGRHWRFISWVILPCVNHLCLQLWNDNH